MNLIDLITLFQKGGFNIYKKGEYYFHNRGLINYSFPFLKNISINRRVVNSLKWKFPITIIKTESFNKNTYEYILRSDDYSLGNFKHRVGKRIIKSLNEFTFRRPSLEDLIYYGLRINRQAMKMQNNRNDKTLTDHDNWMQQATSFYNNKDVIVYAAYKGDRMVGYIITCEFEGRYFNHLKHYDRDMISFSPMQGLLFTVINQIIAEKGHIEISDGIESYKHQPELRRFKVNMLFKRVPATRVYIINPVILHLMSLTIYFYVKILKRKTFRNFYLRTLIHLYQGNRILYEVLLAKTACFVLYASLMLIPFLSFVKFN